MNGGSEKRIYTRPFEQIREIMDDVSKKEAKDPFPVLQKSENSNKLYTSPRNIKLLQGMIAIKVNSLQDSFNDLDSVLEKEESSSYSRKLV